MIVTSHPIFTASVEDRVRRYLNQNLDDRVELSIQRKLPNAVNMWLMSHAQSQALLETVRHRIEQDSQRVLTDVASQNLEENPVFRTLLSRIHINNDTRLSEYERRTTNRLNEENKNLRTTNYLLGAGFICSFSLAVAALVR